MAFNPRLIFATVLVGLSATGALACLWDSDTLAAEAKGLPDVLDVITGRFERNPPLYYEMRLSRVAAEVQTRPEDLGLYDDAGVACDRLGRHDEAIAWMEKKKARLDAADSADPAVKDHTYRYLANLGTFHAHRWLAHGGDRMDLADLRTARDLIVAAIDLNPDAHFGREKYQLMAIEWLLEPPTPPYEFVLPTLFSKELSHQRYSKVDLATGKFLDPSEAVRGLSGLIVLGNAWESVDVYHSFYHALANAGHASLAHFAELRVRELVEKGKRSLHPAAKTGDALVEQIGFRPMVEDHRKPEQQRLYRIARAAADGWHAYRTAFMLERLNAGRHPDTDPTFWDGYSAPTRPELVESELRMAPRRLLRFGGGFPLVIALGALYMALKYGARWARRRLATPPPGGPG